MNYTACVAGWVDGVDSWRQRDGEREREIERTRVRRREKNMENGREL